MRNFCNFQSQFEEGKMIIFVQHQEIAKAELEIDKMNEDMAQIVDVLQVTRKEMDKATKNLV